MSLHRVAAASGATVISLLLFACAPDAPASADLILTGGRFYTLAWPNPAPDGTPADAAPRDGAGWHPDAEALAARNGEIVYVGDAAGAEDYRGPETRVVELDGAVALPGLIDSHTHDDTYAERLTQVDLVGVETPEEAVQRVAAWLEGRDVPEGEWIVGYGWDEGAWTDDYPTMELLSSRVPDHPVFLRGLHGYAVWGNRLAFERAGIDRDTPEPSGGEIVRDESGAPAGVLVDRATRLLADAVPERSLEEYGNDLLVAYDSALAQGKVAVAEADVGPRFMAALRHLERQDRLPLRVWAWIRTQGPDPDTAYMREWLDRGPDTEGPLRVRSVKGFYDGAMGSRGAWLLEPYSDAPDTRGAGGVDYGFSRDWIAEFAQAGFRLSVHAIGTAANRGTLDFFDSLYAAAPGARDLRNRIEHAQVVQPDDRSRFSELGLFVSMQPRHAVDDMPWARDRLGPERIRWAYAWRDIREAGAPFVLSSDLPGAAPGFFRNLHAAVTRQARDGDPEGGWHPDQRLTPEEAIRGFTTWAARSLFSEDEAGTLEEGKRADVTVMDVDPLNVPVEEYARVLDGRILLTVVGGEVAFDGR